MRRIYFSGVGATNQLDKDTFYQRTFLFKNGKVYAYGYENDFAYIYNVQNHTWSKK